MTDVTIRLPFVDIGLGEIKLRPERKQRDAGPFVIISRACGMALDTAFSTDMGSRPILWPPHGRTHQMWFLRPTGTKGEVAIASADNRLVLDSTVPIGDDVHPVLWEEHLEPWQRWRLERAADGYGFFIQSVHNRMYLTASEDAERKWQPWFAGREGNFNQQWMLAMPYGLPS